ncbi:hypothetical protein DFH28DRAFT_908240 [Melampsora americana]|nr:hypothetical protein DFH28DRAFT_908240 [Melampsora americana]
MIGRVGYIPLTKSSRTVLAETQRQKDAGMATCLCSNCSPKAARFFIAQQPALSKLNFTHLVLQDDIPEEYPHFDDQFEDLVDETPSPHTRIRPIDLEDPLRGDLRLIRLLLKIEARLKMLFDVEYPEGGFYTLQDLFPRDKLWVVCANYDLCLDGISLDFIFGSEPLPTAYENILQSIQAWKGHRKDMFAVLDPSEDELQIHYQAKALLQKSQKESQAAKDAAAQRRKLPRLNFEAEVCPFKLFYSHCTFFTYS